MKYYESRNKTPHCKQNLKFYEKEDRKIKSAYTLNMDIRTLSIG